MRINGTRLAALFLALALAAGGASADFLQLKDGRLIENVPMEKVEGGVKVKFKHGEVVIPDRMVNDFIQLSADGTFKPRNDIEAEKMAKGFMPLGGKWLPKAKWERKRQKRIDAVKARIQEAKDHKKWRNRYQEETRNFRFEYTIPKETAHEFMDLFEVYFKIFAKEWGIRRSKKGKLKVCFYHDEDYFHQVASGHGALGYFRFVDPIELNVFNMRNDKPKTISVIFHEVNHYLVHLIDPEFHYPPWVNEGLAEYYGASKWDPKTKKMTLGHIQEWRFVLLKDDIDDGEWWGLEEMIKQESAVLKHYTWGWSFCHFMMHTPKYKTRFKKFFKAMHGKSIKKKAFNATMTTVDPKDQLAALKKYLGVKDLKTLEKEWHDYIKTNLSTQSARGYVDAASMAERNNLPIKATNYYKRALKAGWKTHRLFSSYAELLQRRGKHEEAAKMFAKAIEVDPADPYGYMNRGLCLVELSGKAKKKEGERLQRLALELDPLDDGLEDLAEVELEKK